MHRYERRSFEEEVERRWWSEWFDSDYSWRGLGRVVDGKPLHPWLGRVIEGNVAIRTDEEPVAGQRRATLKDFWAFDPRTGLIRDDKQLRAEGAIVDVDDIYFHVCFAPNERAKKYIGIGKDLRSGSLKLFDDEINIKQKEFEKLIENSRSHPAMPADGVLFYSNSLLKLNFWSLYRSAVFNRSAIEIKSNSISVRDSIFFHYIDFVGEGLDIEVSNTTFFGDVSIRDFISRAIFFGDSTFFLNLKLSFGSSDRIMMIRNKYEEDFSMNDVRVNEGAHLGDSTFVGGASLDVCNFGGNISINNCKFQSNFSVFGSKLNNGLDIKKSEFLSDVIFSNGIGVDNEEHTLEISGNVSMKESIFRGIFRLLDQYSIENELNWQNAFQNSAFENHIYWSENALNAIAAFSQARIVGGISLPNYGEAAERSIHDKLIARASEAGVDALHAVEDGSKAIKLAFLAFGDPLRALSFHRLELRARTFNRRTSRPQRLAGLLYGAFSDWGLCWHRPLLWLGAGAALFASIYITVILLSLGDRFAQVTVGFGLPVHSAIAAGVELSMSNALGPIKYLIGNDGPPALEAVEIPFSVRFGLGLLSILQQVGSLALLFLSALALRRRFQIG